jgi:NAD(P)-dependent dehydrogenase (short-subunit alcohol dehydrogenase family)
MLVTQYLTKELFKGKTVFVTGGGSGINLGVAKNFPALGANVAFCGRTQEKLDVAAGELKALGANVCPVVADVRDFAALETAFARSGGTKQHVQHAGRCPEDLSFKYPSHYHAGYLFGVHRGEKCR